MIEFHRSALVLSSVENMYAIVADITSYPSFMTYCERAEILAQREDQIDARLYIRRGPVSRSFATRNTHRVNQRIDMALIDGPMKSLEGAWTFTPVRSDGAQGCELSLSLRFELEKSFLEAMVRSVMNDFANEMIDAMVRRANALKNT